MKNSKWQFERRDVKRKETGVLSKTRSWVSCSANF